MLQNTSAGLSEAEAKTRLAKVGENRLRGKKGASVAAMFFSQFKDLMILILAAATLISVLMGEGTEAITIIIIVLMNATMGFLQEYRTEKTLEALKELSAPTARVRRSGRELEVGARTVVPGDVLLFEAGDKVAADCTLQTGVQVSCNEAMLTGESLPAAKQPGDRLYMGCIVMTGRGEGVVTATGMETEMGKIAGMMETAGEEPTPLQLKLKQLGRFVAVACVTICLAVGFLGFLQGNDFLEMLLTGISLAVAAIPEGLPAIVTITLALSVNRILRRGAVIRKLHAVETLGCAGVICTDKTGTITQNKMTVQRIWVPGRTLNVSGSGYRAQGAVEENGRPVQAARDAALGKLCEAASLCTTAHITRAKDVYDVMGDPTEVAVLVAAAKAGVTKEALLQQYTVIGENPFDAARKRMSVTVSGPGGARLLCKGAPDMLLARCTHIATPAGPRLLAPRDRADINAACARMAGEALRVLGFAESSTPAAGEEKLCFLGLMGMLDPPRPEVRPAVQRCREAGIKPVMITGDYKETALAIARDVGIARAGDGVLSGTELDALSDPELAARCMRVSVYARVSPAHKLRIVRAYKAAGQVVAMTGDGVIGQCHPAVQQPAQRRTPRAQRLGVRLFYFFAARCSGQQRLKFRLGHRARKVVALHHVTAMLLEEIHILPSLHALRHHFHPQPPRDAQNTLNYNLAAFFRRFGKHFTVQLEHGHRQRFNAVQGGIATAEIIHGAHEAVLIQLLHKFRQTVIGLQHQAFGDFKFHILGRHIVLLEKRQEFLCEKGHVGKVRLRQIH